MNNIIDTEEVRQLAIALQTILPGPKRAAAIEFEAFAYSHDDSQQLRYKVYIASQYNYTDPRDDSVRLDEINDIEWIHEWIRHKTILFRKF